VLQSARLVSVALRVTLRRPPADNPPLLVREGALKREGWLAQECIGAFRVKELAEVLGRVGQSKSGRKAVRRPPYGHTTLQGHGTYGARGGDADAVRGMWCVLAGSHPAPAPVLQPNSWRVRRPVPRRGFKQRPCDEYTPSTRVQHLRAVLPIP
jgi:hypothetical protein